MNKIENKKKRIKTTYSNGCSVRLLNKRISVYHSKKEDEEINVCFQAILPPEEMGFDGCFTYGKHYKQVGFRLSREAAIALLLSLRHVLLINSTEFSEYEQSLIKQN